jgi:tight adherence protein C
MIDFLLQPANIIMALASAGAFLTIVAFGMPLLERDALTSRLKSVARRREELQAANRARHAPQQSKLRQQMTRNYIKAVVENFKLLNPANSQALKDKLAQAGHRGQGPLYTYAFFRFVAPFAFVGLAAIYLFLLAKIELSVGGRVMICLGAGVVGFIAPGVVLSNMVAKRQQSVTKAFPDALDLMVICVEAGLSMEAAFHRVADEIQETSPQLAEELGLTTAELAFLPDRRGALENLAKRTGLPGMKALTTSLAQAEKYGTPISVSLRVLSNEQRDERMNKAERKAGALPAQLTVPMIAFFLPVLFIVLLGPAIIKTMQTL